MTLVQGLCLAVSSALLLTAGQVSGQERPVGAEQASIAEQLGGCRVDLIERAWAEIGALEAAAVELEILRLCADRARAVAAFLGDYEKLREAVETGQPRSDGQANQADPSGQIDADSGQGSSQPDRTVPSLASENEEAVASNEAAAEGPASAEAQTDPVLVPEQSEPSPPEIRWHVLFTARSGEASWRAGLQRSERVRRVVPEAVTDDLAAAPLEAFFEWVSDHGAPLLVAEGDTLPNGFEIVRIDVGGVQVRPEGGGTGADLPWVEGGDPSAPGETAWTWTQDGGAGEANQ